MTFETWFPEYAPEIAPKIGPHSVRAVLELVAEGCTLPFIARYRKEKTGNLDEVAIQAVIEAHEKWEALLRRQKHVVEEIERQQKLTPELRDLILTTFQLEKLEDIYLPYKQKRKTKAQAAREAGLEPLADWLWGCGHGTDSPQPGQTLEIWAFTFRNEAKGIVDAETAIAGAQDILVERLSEMQDLRSKVREKLLESGGLKTGKGPKVKPHSKYENYFNYFESVASLMQPQNSHRYLAARRGWVEEELTLGIGGKPDAEGKGDSGLEDELQAAFEAVALTHPGSPGDEVLKKAARLAFKAHVLPSIESETHKKLREVADAVAIQVFAENVRKLLLASPFGPKAVLGVDPGIRTGCKLAVVDDAGKYIASTVMHLQTAEAKEAAKTLLTTLVKEAQIRAVAVGNGTAGRETESFIRATLKAAELASVPVIMVSESGASVYSASEAAREEFPELDVTVRGAISIARRLQDPLAELVKVEPKSIGVGQYQHDVSEHTLKRSLETVVDSCVNQVGVNLNTASYHLLARVAGIGPTLARSIVEFRGAKGIFKSRQELMEVTRFSSKTFEQAAGFLRVPESENPLENTGVHPERYELIEARARALGKSLTELMGDGVAALKADTEFKEQVGAFTFDDIIAELEKPGRDPREDFVPFQYRDDIYELKDLKQGMICPGIITNVTAFGAFVDIGVHQDGLVHLSQLATRYVKDPHEVASPGDRVQVKVLGVDLEKSQISLSIKQAQENTREEGAGSGKPKRERSRRPSQKRGKPPEEAKPPRNKADLPPPPVVLGQPKPERKPPAVQLGAPKHERPQSSRPRPGAGSGAGAGAQRRDSRDNRNVQPRGPKQIFNNAFAGLASLKDQLKK